METAVVSRSIPNPVPIGPPAPPAAHVSNLTVYVAPAGEGTYVAPSGGGYVAPPDGASGVGIFASYSA